ncbi:MAG TPA: hypothetical protein VK783_07570 [Bacteroidia bacterium]|jgi:hypothetical protein|nr:hypothetical protein [Bacteroidia bacterium]
MYKTIILGGLICALFSFSSCKPKASEDADEAPLGAGMIRMSLSSVGMPVTIDIPDTEKTHYGIETLPSGDVHVYVNKGFNILINVSGMDMNRKKKDIAGNDVDKFQSWVTQDSSGIVYKTQMVNEEYHFYAIVKKGDKTFYVQEQSQGSDGNVTNFNQAQAQAMYESAKTITPVAPKAKA